MAFSSEDKTARPLSEIFRVQHLATIDGTTHHAITDLIFDAEHPIAVLAWGGDPNNEHPLVIVRLDPAHLQEFRSGAVTHLYNALIEDPRKGPKTQH